MKSIQRLAFLNFAAVLINFSVFVLINSERVFGSTLKESVLQTRTYLTPHILTSKAWSLLSIGLIAVFLLQWLLTKKESQQHTQLEKQIQSTGPLIIINQILFMTSMILKTLGMIWTSCFITPLIIYTLHLINKKFGTYAKCEEPEPSMISQLTKITLAGYFGLLFFVMAFNILLISRNHRLIENEFIHFTVAVFLLFSSLSFVLYFAIKKKIPSAILCFSVGLIGNYYALKTASIGIYTEHMKIAVGIGIGISIITIIFSVFQEFFTKRNQSITD